MGAVDHKWCECEALDHLNGRKKGYCKRCQKRTTLQNIIVIICLTGIIIGISCMINKELNIESCFRQNYDDWSSYHKCVADEKYRMILFLLFPTGMISFCLLWADGLISRKYQYCNIKKARFDDKTRKTPDCHYCTHQSNYRFFKNTFYLFGMQFAVNWLKKKYNH